MKGYPAHLNTKEDYEYVRENFPAEQWKPDWQALLDTMTMWRPEYALTTKDNGVENDTHKIVEIRDDISGEVSYMQYVLDTNPTCKLLSLGFTKNYVESILA